MPFDAATYQPPVIDPLSLTTPGERLMYLRDFLQELPAGRFDMIYYGRTANAEEFNLPTARVRNDCGTAACICGWANVVFGEAETDDMDAARNLLGLDYEAGHDLFMPEVWMSDDTHAWSATPADAAQVLTHLIETGEVDWSVARRDGGHEPSTMAGSGTDQ